VKLRSPDYTDCNMEEAVVDFMKRIQCYENSYQTLDEVLDRYAGEMEILLWIFTRLKYSFSVTESC